MLRSFIKRNHNRINEVFKIRIKTISISTYYQKLLLSQFVNSQVFDKHYLSHNQYPDDISSMIGKINGWFIQTAVHPISFGIGSIIKKPIVVNDEIKIREVLNMTVLMDHDIIDGAPMARFIDKLTQNIENGLGL
jgi:hypothetical protein